MVEDNGLTDDETPPYERYESDGIKKYKCIRCEYATTFRPNVLRHAKVHSGDRPFKCRYCDDAFIQKVNLKRHLARHERSTGFGKYKRKKYKYSCKREITPDDAKENESFHENHSEEEVGESDDDSGKQYEAVKSEEADRQWFKCSSCEYTSFNRHHVIRHAKLHTGERPFECLSCGATFIQKINLERHMKKHEKQGTPDDDSVKADEDGQGESEPKYKKLYKCSSCAYSTFVRTNVVRHAKRHSGEKPFACPSCEASFIQKVNLEKHQKHRNHYGEGGTVKREKEDDVDAEEGFYEVEVLEEEVSAVKQSLKESAKLNEADKNKVYKCSFCEYTSSLRPNVARHEKVHLGERPFKCSRCSAAFIQKVNLEKHQETRNHFAKNEKKQMEERKRKREAQRSEKRKRFSEELSTTFKKVTEHRDADGFYGKFVSTIDASPPGLHACLLCDFIFVGRKQADEHVRRCYENKDALAPAKQENELNTVQLNYQCSLCDFKCSEQEEFLRHEQLHQKGSHYKCSLCEFDCSEQEELLQHEQLHASDCFYKCKLCEYDTKDYDDLASHMESHEEGSCVCDTCGKIFRDMRNLKRHQFYCRGNKRKGKVSLDESDAEAKRYECYTCSRKFTEMSNLRRHLHYCAKDQDQTINLDKEKQLEAKESPPEDPSDDPVEIVEEDPLGVKPDVPGVIYEDGKYRCSRCDYVSYLKTNVVRHMLVHTGEKPYECRVCRKGFRQRGALKKHYAVHPGKTPEISTNFRCRFCDRAFPEVGHLRNHEKIHRSRTPDAGDEVCDVVDVDDLEVQSEAVPEKDPEEVIAGLPSAPPPSDVGWSETPKNKRFHCNVCGIKFKRLQVLLRHKRVHRLKKKTEAEGEESNIDLTAESDEENRKQDDDDDVIVVDDNDVTVVEDDPIAISPKEAGDPIATVPKEADDPIATVPKEADDPIVTVPKEADDVIVMEHDQEDRDSSAPEDDDAFFDLFQNVETVLEEGETDLMAKLDQSDLNGSLNGGLSYAEDAVGAINAAEISGESDSGEGEHSCDVCGHKTSSYRKLLRHRMIHKNEKPYKCRYCEREFRHVINRDKHELTHLASNPEHQCPICGKQLMGAAYLRNHVRNHEKDSDAPPAEETSEVKKPVTCGLCGKGFKGLAWLRNHERSRHMLHQDSPQPPEEQDEAAVRATHPCSICGKLLMSATFLRNHLRKHEKDSSTSETQPEETADVKKSVKCGICGKGFMGKAWLRNHERSRHQLHQDSPSPPEEEAEVRATHACSICGKQLTSAAFLRNHLRKHERDSDAASTSETQPEDTADVKKPFKCSLCGKGFKGLACLRNHERSRHMLHQDSPPPEEDAEGRAAHPCSICGKQLTSPVYLRNHMRNHEKDGDVASTSETTPPPASSDVKPIKCDLCDKSFTSLAYLRNHERSRHMLHQDSPPPPEEGAEARAAHQCSICGKQLTTAAYLRNHVRNHERNGDTTSTYATPPPSDVNKPANHEGSHHRDSSEVDADDRPAHQCDVCGKKFKRLAHLRNHEKVHRRESEASPAAAKKSKNQYECLYCDFSSDDYSCFFNHLADHAARQT